MRCDEGLRFLGKTFFQLISNRHQRRRVEMVIRLLKKIENKLSYSCPQLPVEAQNHGALVTSAKLLKTEFPAVDLTLIVAIGKIDSIPIASASTESASTRNKFLAVACEPERTWRPL